MGLAMSSSSTTRSLEDGPDGPHESVPRFWIVVTSGPDAGKTLTSAKERAVVGTHESADLVLTDETVSRFHFEVVAQDGRLLLRDLGSRNGTTLNGVAVLAAYLTGPSAIRVGRSELSFELRSDPVKVPIHPSDRFCRMVGASVPMRRAFALLELAAASESGVLIEGETGTGKELAAESIHEMSSRKDGPFIVVDCASIPAELLESELFGHEKGAFTGAVTAREGAFEAASGGTIFLDEIGELELSLQPKLLRALERKQIKRVGSTKYVPADVRIVAATNRNLRREVNERRFRSDLYYRLAVVEIRLPPLRERAGDMRTLVTELLRSLGADKRPEAADLSRDDFIAELARHTWSGNVRELRNYLERCLVMRSRAPLDAPDDDAAGTEIAFDKPLKVAREAASRAFERRYVEAALARAGGNVTAAARAAEVDRMYFYRLLWRHGLK